MSLELAPLLPTLLDQHHRNSSKHLGLGDSMLCHCLATTEPNQDGSGKQGDHPPRLRHVWQSRSNLSQDGDEGVALESCEFWSAFCEAAVEPAMLRPFLPRLVPVLLKNMVYDEYDEEVQDAEAAEEQVGTDDRDQEVKPFIHK